SLQQHLVVYTLGSVTTSRGTRLVGMFLHFCVGMFLHFCEARIYILREQKQPCII
ncbi:hypothetical protein ACJX0J_010841, partial [Zea mays]